MFIKVHKIYCVIWHSRNISNLVFHSIAAQNIFFISCTGAEHHYSKDILYINVQFFDYPYKGSTFVIHLNSDYTH